MRRLGATAVVAAGLVVPAGASAGGPARCADTSVRVTAGTTKVLNLDCAVRAKKGRRYLARGLKGKARRAITTRPRHGVLGRLDSRRGTVRYRPAQGFTGRDSAGYRLRLPGGRRLAGRIVISVTAAVRPLPQPPPAGPLQPPPSLPAADGLPARLPPAAPSIAFGTRNWAPAAQDTCPASVHERFSVIGPDGKVYPGWHPPSVVDPATGKSCTFGHEHGRDPARSDIAGWVASHFAAAGKQAFAGIPFGQATEALEEWSIANPGNPKRQEDHVGYKIDYVNDVALVAADGSALGIACDYLVRVHQGTHSADATNNNVHELLYAARCSDGTELISNTVTRFGNPGEFTRSCDPAVKVATTDNGYPDGDGERSIPDRSCMETTFLVPAGRTTSVWAAYEKWSGENELRTADPGADPLASYDAAFGVFNPSRYADPAAGSKIGRTVSLCWETLPDGSRADGQACSEATADGSIATAYGFDDVRSTYDGTKRDFYLRRTTVENDGGPTKWWTDPYGGNASATPFPGAICQLVAPVDNSGRPPLQQRIHGRNRTNDAPGVHAPN